MIKILFIPLLLSLFLHAIDFKEIKLIEALDLETFRYGSISYDKEKTIINYKDGKIITKVDHALTVHNQKHELLTTIDLRKKPQIALYFRLTKALLSKNFDTLKDNFDIKKQSLKYHFIPKGDTAKVVEGIELLVKSDGSVVYFVIDFVNRDSIKIETL
jgi:hypothetical protein